jgi:hypothetical protein
MDAPTILPPTPPADGPGLPPRLRTGYSLLPSELDSVTADGRVGGTPGVLPGVGLGAAPSSDTASELAVLLRSLTTLAAACADSVEKASQHFHGEDAWLIGALPACTHLADGVEARARGYIAHSHLTPADVNDVSDLLKAAADLRAAARGARQAAQIAPLLLQEAGSVGADMLLEPVCAVADTAVNVALAAVEALRAEDIPQARGAALLYRAVDDARQRAERAACRDAEMRVRYSPTALRLARAAALNFAVSGEAMARVAVRLVLTEK